MKKWLIGILALAAIILPKLGTPATDIGKLEPVSVVQIIAGKTGIELYTDTGAVGRGNDLLTAVNDLKESAPKEIFLDTADFVLLWGNLTREQETIQKLFRPACGVCRAAPGIDLPEAAAYLKQHPPGRTLGELRTGQQENQRLIVAEGRGMFCPIQK